METISTATTTTAVHALGFESTCAAARELYQDHANQLLQIYQRQVSIIINNKNNCCTKDDDGDVPLMMMIPSNELVLISGPSGSGKTCLATVTLEERTRRDGGYFCRGKFDQSAALSGYHHHVDVLMMKKTKAAVTTTTPHYSHTHAIMCNDVHHPFVSMITELIHQIIQRHHTTDNNNFLNSLQQSLLNTLDSSELQVLEASIPDLKKFTRRQSDSGSSSSNNSGIDPSKLSSSLSLDVDNHHHNEHWLSLKGPDAEKRHVQVFSKLFQAIRSLLIVDSSSCTFVATTSNATDDNNDDECLDGELVEHQAESIHSVKVMEVRLDNLTKDDVRQLVSKVWNMPLAKTQSMADIVHHRTKGNLFFITQLLSVLEGEGQLQFCSSNNIPSLWIWNEQMIFDTKKPQSILGLLTQKILQLPDSEQRMLRVAACLGGTIYNCLLEERVTFAPELVQTTLCSLQRHGLIKLDDTKQTGCFLHDQIQEAAYSLIPKGHHAAVHLDLGRSLWKELSPTQLDTHLFTVVTQIQRGLHLLDDRIEKEDLAALFLCAGRKAVFLWSFPAAATYFGIGIHLLGQKGWKYQYKRNLALHNAAAEVEYYIGNAARVDALVADVLENAKSLDDKLQAHVTQIYSYGSQDDMKQALAKGLEILKSLGVTFLHRPGKLNALIALGRCRRRLQKMSDDGIMKLPLMTDHRQLMVMRIMNTIYGYAFSSDETLVAIIASKMVDTTIQYGISALSCVGFALLGFCLGRSGQTELSYRCGYLALRLVERFQAKEWQCRVALLVYGGVYSVKYPLKELVKPLRSAHCAGMVAGDINASLVCASFQCRMSFYAGAESLPRVVSCLEEYKRLCGYYGQRSVSMMLSPQLQVCFNLMGRAKDPLVLTGEAMDENATLAFLQGKHPVALSWLLLSKHYLAVYLNDLEGAKSIATKLRKMNIGAVLPFVLQNHLFLEGMTAAALSRTDQKQLQRATRILAKLKSFLHVSRDNCESKVYLLEAEILASNISRGDERSLALSKYRLSIEAARRQGFLHEEAMAFEKAGYSLLMWGDLVKSRDYLTSASYLYDQWGAFAKVKQIHAFLCGLALKPL